MTTYIDLCNLVIRHFNDVEFDTTNFSGSIGFHAFVKDAVNNALSEIYEGEIEWPFNHFDFTQVLTPHVQNYQNPVDSSKIDWNTFRLNRDDTLPVAASPLTYIAYYDYIQHWYKEDVADDIGTVPRMVYRKQDGTWGVSKSPDKAYSITYEYWKHPGALSAITDTPTVPDNYSFVIVRGAIAQCYMFKQNATSFQVYDDKFTKGIKLMRTQLMNRYEYMTDHRVGSQSSSRRTM